ncbi:hypothetical protein [Ralstonia syzygii]|uniref:hypothetical protein n=1 Tax=Ralstonia syzygii TaxID=28097 RepID=UPI0018D18BD1|nr:hypothetical protein [Ralstonia syzygii]
MSENPTTAVLFDAISVIFQTHPNPERLRAEWESRIARIEQTLQIPGEKPDPQVARALTLAKALLGEISDQPGRS